MNAQLERAIDSTECLITAGELSPSNQPLVPAEQWVPNKGHGLLLAVDTEPASHHAAADLIAIDFPAFTDGRGLSLAVLLRTRYGFTGELRAVGDINADLLHYLARCGFDSFELPTPNVDPDGNHATTGFNTLAPYSDNYQASVMERKPAYRRVRRGA
jgi:uncharacterized protein (DUF934 family)